MTPLHVDVGPRSRAHLSGPLIAAGSGATCQYSCFAFPEPPVALLLSRGLALASQLPACFLYGGVTPHKLNVVPVVATAAVSFTCVTTPLYRPARGGYQAGNALKLMAMEGSGSGGSGTATPTWDLGMHWAPAGSGYTQQPFAPRAGEEHSRDHFHHQQRQQEQQSWLNLGKRPCCWAGAGSCCHVPQQPSWGHAHGGGGSGVTAAESKRKEKAAAVVPRCQVEGCHVALGCAKEYHRRHKVCEAHSKAPRVVVLGAEQRFCQQCSRFHAISEFDDAKRSCRRRLAGHNERRRKSNASEAIARSVGHPHGIMPCGLPSSPAGALSLLSSTRGGAPWLIPAAGDISALSSAALDELIAENRASLLAWQFFSDRSPGWLAPPSSTGRVLPGSEVPGWHTTTPLHAHPGGDDRRADDGATGGYSGFEGPSTGHTTLDLMQTPAASADTPFRSVPERAARSPKGDGDAGCSSDAWASVEGAPPGGRVV